jgi:hypothetical protein
MAIPGANHAVVSEDKVRGYLLNLRHGDGGSKAVWFHQLGYTDDVWRELKKDLLRIARSCQTYQTESTPYGVKYKAARHVGRRGHRPGLIMSVWIVEGDTPLRLVTAYPMRSA